MDDPYGKRDFERGKKVAHGFGAECQANAGMSIKDYLEDLAFYSGDDNMVFDNLPKEHRDALIIEFNKGIKAEKALQ